jgi:mannose-6-phosphate isomerase-like protein (cupin superfamily)
MTAATTPQTGDATATGGPQPLRVFELARLLADHQSAGRLYHEFLRVPALSVGIYKLPAGATDPQQPHTEDEIYYVIDGDATVWVAGEERSVGPGAVIYVAAGVEHRFHTITADLTLLVFFAPAEAE